ncbi:glycosyltransferase 87 family protein [Acidicapsa ligni]|uniref:glycosyltransferase 87 family protein n=1 Tax=Acidicapsa ligni TaxID=542300 RepID=UPI0021E00C36|nr:glycosyltransferase 87 family protein [Acidicapsa ligni]
MSLISIRAVSWAERVILCFAVLFFCVHSLPRTWRTLNTDFPNYYTAARLAHEGYDTSRMYEWPWIEREKDHRGIDIRVIGLLPITPFSTLTAWPVAELEPLVAKHIWIILNVVFLVPIAWMLQSMTRLSYQRISLVILLSYPMYRNLLYGQFYIFLLLLLTAACFSYLRGYRVLAGVLVAIAAACKIFPLLLFVFFLQRRDWRALASATATGLSAIAVSIAVFGVNANRTWLEEILPWVTRGEGLGIYTTTPSISGVLHCLFLSEPQLNPHPWHDSPLIYALLAPALQMLVLAPAILFIRKGDESKRQILLEWSALLTAALAISTIPASYNFVLMIFPVCVLSSILLQNRRYAWLACLIVAYLGIGFPLPVPLQLSGLALLLYVPRLPLMMAVLFGIYALLWRRKQESPDRDWSRYAWAVIMVASVLLSTRSTLRVERAEREEYAYRLPLQAQGFLSAEPQSTVDGVRYAAFTAGGYRLMTEGRNGVQADSGVDAAEDDLSFTSGFGHTLVERASVSGSRIVDLQNPSRTLVENAREPMISSDGHDLAFLQDDHGRGRLMFRPTFESNSAETRLTPLQWNVYEASFRSEGDYAVSAVEGDSLPKIFLMDATHKDAPITIATARFPALSPDGRWLAYSHLNHGVWNLWLRDDSNGSTRRIADVPCNQIQPSWASDSKTLLYGTDCGRSIWFTAIARRKVLP